jgi:hypothetical protein
MNAALLTPSLDTCDALKRAGFPQTTVFAWGSEVGQRRPPRVFPRGITGSTSEESAAPTLSEILAHLPSELSFALPHPIFGSTDRAHTLEVSLGRRAVIGYHRVGSREVQHRTEHGSAVEAAARLYLALREAGRLHPHLSVGAVSPDAVFETGSLAQAA